MLRNAFHVKEGYQRKGIYKQIAVWLVYSEYARLAKLGYTSAITLHVNPDTRTKTTQSKSTGNNEELDNFKVPRMVYKQGQYLDVQINRLAIGPKPKL